jgi:23S rRNA (pseudouridine1915-N3)-methyltransferase
MRIYLLAVGRRMPGWVNAGVKEYVRRLPPEWGFVLKEVPVSKRRSASPAQCVEEEGERLLAALPKNFSLAALHEHGVLWTTEELAVRVGAWLQSRRSAVLMIGGPDGLAPVCLERADELWSLSRLTLPHALVRVIVAEQLYRASTIIRGHPYHRS